MSGTTVIGHFKAKLVVRIEYCGIVGDAHYGLFDARQLFQGFDTAEAQVIGRNVDTGGNIAFTVTEASP